MRFVVTRKSSADRRSAVSQAASLPAVTRAWTSERLADRRSAIRQTGGLRYTKKIVSFFGPCAPSTRMRSMSPVRLGPVMKDIMLG